jgi:hypothetical protein
VLWFSSPAYCRNESLSELGAHGYFNWLQTTIARGANLSLKLSAQFNFLTFAPEPASNLGRCNQSQLSIVKRQLIDFVSP